MIAEAELQARVEQARAEGIKRFAVGGFIEDDRGRIPLLRRAKGEFLEGLFELPSGGVENGEHPLDALKREIFEETGLTVVDVVKYVSFFDYTEESDKPTRQLNFLVKIAGPKNITLSSEHDEFRWIGPNQEELLQLDRPMCELVNDFFSN